MFAHGAQKVLGWYGGNGFDVSMQGLTSMVSTHHCGRGHFHGVFGAIALVAGLLGRIAALGIAIEMIVAVLLVHLQHGFFELARHGRRRGIRVPHSPHRLGDADHRPRFRRVVD